MRDLEKYRGIIPAFYACYEDDGSVSAERTQALTQHLIDKNVKGVYVCGSSGECIYQSKEERKLILENVMKVAKGKITVIAHVACNNTADSQELAGVALSIPLYKEMLKNPNVIGVKNSSMPVQDIQMFKDVKGDDSVVFNGPDEQFISGRLIGADGGIGGTYAVMPELFLAADEALKAGNIERAKEIQYKIDRIIYAMCSCHGNLYAVMKEILKMNGLNIGGVRKPLASIIPEDIPQIEKCREMISTAIAQL